MSKGCLATHFLFFRSTVSRYKSPDEHPFFPEDLPKPVLPPMQYPEVYGFCLTSHPFTRNPENVAAVILGSGVGTRLFPLTQIRATPVVLVATQTPGEDRMKWFQGTADAVGHIDLIWISSLADGLHGFCPESQTMWRRCLHMDDRYFICLLDSRASDFGLMKIGDTSKSQSHFLQREAQGRDDLII
ncbi:Chorismate mutase 1 [Carex littledalei]|uniref:Chorismate mutase 1 n=1 Tax=Carex littledalei TaxID=544730 RepID=A0A833QAX2_9POAL|nr:Chorismate mutase 1 [Carex littledalei]